MAPYNGYLLAADALLILHTAIVLFVVLSLPLILAGGALNWGWVRNLWFRLAHLGAIGIVVAQAWLGAICPLTRWETELRLLAGDTGYEGSFIAYWLSRLIYYAAPAWVFTLVYTLFGLSVAYAWFAVRPRFRRDGRAN